MSVHQRKSNVNSWYVNITINKKRIRKVIPEARTRREAERAERVILRELFENRYGNGGQKIFENFVEESYKPHSKAHKKGYYVELSVLKVLIERFGKKKLCEISPAEIEVFKRERASQITSRSEVRSKATVNRDIAVLSAVFSLAQKFGELKENPVRQVKFYSNLNSRDRILSDDEENILFDFIKDDIKFSRQVEILLYTGMRRGELFKLEWRDIDFADGFISLRKETTKTQKARLIPMFFNVRGIFEALLDETENIQPKDKIFCGIASQLNKFSQKFKEITDSLGLEGLNVHSLRHTFSTRANKYNVDAFSHKSLLGHAKLSMTDKYTHVSKDMLKASVKPFEQHIRLSKDTQAKSKEENTAKQLNLLPFRKNE
jgi:integrase